MSGQGKLITGMLVGAGTMYLLDPDRGSRRRSLLRNQGLQLGQFRQDQPGEENWAPAVRVAIGTLGGALAVKGTRTKGTPGNLLRLLGLSLLARAASNIPARRLVELGIGQPGFVAEKTILVSAPIDEVWELWSHFENFPRFMAHLREVRKLDEGRSHWVAAGPAGVSVEWDAVVTDWVPNVFIAWTSVEGSSIETSGQVRLRALSENETQIDVQLSYRPPAGAAGHALATLLGTDPKQAMDEDLAKLKSLLESQKTSPPEGPVLQEVVGGEKTPARRQRSRKRS
jgi:uncharacterized membrane protein